MSEFVVLFTTGSMKYAGTNACVAVTLGDVKGQTSGPHWLDQWFRNDFERGQTDDFRLEITSPELEELSEIEITFDEGGFGSDWYCEKVWIEDVGRKTEHIFPVNRWLKRSKSIKLTTYDSSLPQSSKHPEQRRAELEERRKLYEYKEAFEGFPIQVKELPEDEHFPDDVKWDIMKRKYTLLAEVSWNELWQSNERFTSLAETVDYFKNFPSLDTPSGAEYWNDDDHFALQRMNGCNPKLIRLCTEIPEHFQIDEKSIEPFMETRNVERAISDRRLFIVDLKILEGIYYEAESTLCTPLALFYLTDSKHLLPIAIQLFQSKGPVFYPSDDANLWLLVKMWYNTADAAYHQSCAHLHGTHLVMEGICACTNRQLSPSHPIYRLIAPHFLYLLAINTRGLSNLIAPGGWVDLTMVIGVEGMIELVSKRHGQLKVDQDLDFKEDLRNRGLLEDVLPGYYYRQDGLALFEAINNYVDKMVHLFYLTEEDMINDYELQNWAKELVAPRADLQGLGLQGVPGNGQFHNYEDLIKFVRILIFVCSCEHAAVNFSQYDNYSVQPNYPAKLLGTPPGDKRPVSEGDIVACLLSKPSTAETMFVTKLLSTRSTNHLGDFEVQYHYHPDVQKIVDEFRQELKEISDRIQAEMPNRSFEYPILDPEVVPNSISI